MSPGLLVCVASDIERRALEDVLAGREVKLLVTGVGPANAAHATTAYLARKRAGRVLSWGIGGAYPGSELEVGAVACASTEVFGDLGAESPDGFLDLDALGFPAPEPRLDIFPCEPRVPFVTCSMCTGTDERAAALRERTGGAVENMEGAAVVMSANHFGIPAGEMRGISNMVGRRDRDAWRLREAMEAARAALLAWIESC